MVSARASVAPGDGSPSVLGAAGNLAVVKRPPANLPAPYTTALPPDAAFAMRPPNRTPSAGVDIPGRLTRVADWKIDPTLLAGIAWQPDAFSIYRAVPQIRKVENVKANTVAACDLVLRELDENDQPVETEDEGAIRVFRMLTGPKGGRDELMRMFALLADIAGECFLLGTPTEQPKLSAALESVGDSAGMVWEFVSRQELRGDRASIPGKIAERDSTGATSVRARVINPSSFVARWHQADPEFSEQPDSPLRSVIPDATEYLQLRDVVSGVIKSHMSAPLLLIPRGMGEDDGFGDDDEDDDEAEDKDDPFMRTLMRHMSTAVLNRRDPAVYVPHIIEFEDAEMAKAVRFVEPGNKAGDWAIPLRQEKLSMIAQSLDAPPEEMEGHVEINHWGMYSLDQKFNSKWVIPRGEQLAQFLSYAYLWTMLVAYEGYDQARAERFVILLDPSEITAKADKGVTALRLYDRNLLAADDTLEANGFDADQQPALEETLRIHAWDMVKKNNFLLPAFWQLLQFQEAGVDMADVIEALERERESIRVGPLPVPIDDTQPAQPALPAGGDETGAAPADQQSPGLGPGTGDANAGAGEIPANSDAGTPRMSIDEARAKTATLAAFDRLVVELLTAADMSAELAVSKATSRLMNAASKRTTPQDLGDRLRAMPKGQAFRLVGQRDLIELGMSRIELLADAWESLEGRATIAVSSFLASTLGLSSSEVAWKTREAVAELVDACQVTLLRTGGDPTHDGGMIAEETVRTALALVLSSRRQLLP